MFQSKGVNSPFSSLCRLNILNSSDARKKIESLIVNKMKLGEPDDSGRRKPIIKENSEFKIEADIVILQLG